MIPLQSTSTLRLFLFLLFLAVCSAQPLLAARKEALLIANSRYSHFPGLPNSLSDAAKLRAALEKIGFRVRLVSNASKEQMDDAVRDFENQLRNTGAIAFFHYGGHGVQVDGKNYLIPSDAEIPDENRVSTRSLPLEEVMAAMAAAATRASIVVVDACRDNPLPATSDRSMARGLSVVEQKPNIIVIFSAQAGRIAKDGLFTPILANAIQTPGRTIEQIMKTVRSEVYQKSGRTQTPGEYNQLFEDFFLWDGPMDEDPIEFFSKPTPTPTPTPKSSPAPQPTPATVMPKQVPTPVKNQKPLDANMVFVEGGKLPVIPSRSCPYDEREELSGKLVASFYIGKTEVTWAEWKSVREWATSNGYDLADKGKGSRDNHPVREISWYYAVKWCNAKSEMTGLTPVYSVQGETYRSGEFAHNESNFVKANFFANGYRLPTEAEWEWAARGGNKSKNFTYSGGNNLDTVGWYSGNSKGATVVQSRGRGTWPVAQKAPNELGIYDMSGNVFEMVWNENRSKHIFKRGGSWHYLSDKCQLSDRGFAYGATERSVNSGFRLAKTY